MNTGDMNLNEIKQQRISFNELIFLEMIDGVIITQKNSETIYMSKYNIKLFYLTHNSDVYLAYGFRDFIGTDFSKINLLKIYIQRYLGIVVNKIY